MERKLSENEKQSIEMCEHACEILRRKNIPHKVCKKTIGHINLLGYVRGKTKIKPIMSFWARTGKYVFLIEPKGLIKCRDSCGLNNCILSYENFIKLENEELEII